MHRLLNFFSAHPWGVLAVLFALSLVAASQLRYVEVHVSADELLVIDDPERQYLEQVRQLFGDEEVVLLYLEDDEVAAPDKLKVLQDVVTQLEALPFVDRLESLFSVPHLRSVDGYLKTDPYLKELPESREAGRDLVAQALENPFVRNVLISADGRVMAVGIVLDENMDDDEYEVTGTIDTVTAPLKGVYTDVFVVGFPYVRIEIADKLGQEQADLVPLAVGALLISLFILLRQVVDILIPILTAGISILWTLGLMGATGVPINVVTSIVPILLIIIGSTEDIHLLSEFRRGQQAKLDTLQALDRMAAKMGRTVLLTFSTTFAGFLSVGLSGIEVLVQFGVLAAVGLLFNFAATISLIPAVLRLTGRWRFGHPGPGAEQRGIALADAYWKWLHRYRWRVVILLGAAVAIASFGFPRIELNHNAVDNLARDSVVRTEVERVNENLAGLESLSIIVTSGIEDTFLKVRYLKELAEIQSFIEKTGKARSTTSFADYLALMNGVFQELDGPRMPVNDDEVYELMIFLDHDHVKGYVSEDYSTARVLVRHHISSTRELQEFVDSLNRFIDAELDPGLEARITGDSMLTLSATRSMITGQLKSVLLLLGFVILLMSVLFTDVKAGLLAALPNAFPVAILFGVMGFADIPLNVGTTMAAAIAIGLAVDDTMHFMLRYNQELKSSKSQSTAIRRTIREEALPVTATSVALIAGFLVFALSDFEPVAQFGILSALVIGTALVADFIITPLVMSSLRLVTLWDLMSAKVRQQVIPKSALFRGMRPWQIRRFILSSTLLEYGPGEYVFRNGDRSNELYLMMRGVVETSVLKAGSATERVVIDQFGSGEIFGDVALLANESRHADAVTLVPTCVLVVNRDAIRNATLFHPYLSSRLFLNVATDMSRRWVRLVERTKERSRDQSKEQTGGGDPAPAAGDEFVVGERDGRE